MDDPGASEWLAFIESDAVDNDNWLNDPEDITWADFTEGTDAIVLTKIGRIQRRGNSGVGHEPRPGGDTFMTRTDLHNHQLMYEAIVSTLAEKKLVENFHQLARHTQVASFKPYYLVHHYSTDTYETFIDDSGTAREYCQCIIDHVTSERPQPNALKWTLRFAITSTFGGD